MKWRSALVLLASLLLAAAPDKGAGRREAQEQTADPRTEETHKVREGETIGGIAQRAEVPRVLIIEANGLKPPYTLRKGQDLVIPRRRIHTVVAGETGFGIAYDYGVAWKDIALANGLDPAARLKPGAKLAIPTITAVAAEPAPAASPVPAATERQARIAAPPVRALPSGAGKAASADKSTGAPQFRWPAPGKVRRGFSPAGSRGNHPAVDIAGEEGSDVRAAARGTVIFAGDEPRRFGNLVIIDHGKGWFTAYAKLQAIKTRKGKKVGAGDRIGLLGHTGETPSTELHFEIRRNNVPVDPLVFLPVSD